jgi:hypothetical protein
MAISTETRAGNPPSAPGLSRPNLIMLGSIVVVVLVTVVAYLVLSGNNHTPAAPATGTHAGQPSGGNDGQPVVAPSTTPTTTQGQATTAAILDGYKTAEAIFLADANAYPANALDPRIAQHMTGPELRTVQTYLTQLRIQGHHGVGTWTLTPRVTLISTSTTATITDCISDHTSVVDGRTGKTISGPDTKTTSDQITMVLQSGTWMISDDQRVGVGCVPAP